jgi:EAL domain-containing protein (putative c-di-GMP-specific phosphodiesterase class I)
MDDFGTGFSSLAHLMHLPFEQIKIDQSFVRDLHANPATKTIVQAIITMAKGLGLDVIAEGVESERERDTLERIGCPTYQGFLFSRPLPLFEVERLLPAYLASS